MFGTYCFIGAATLFGVGGFIRLTEGDWKYGITGMMLAVVNGWLLT